MSGTDRQWNDRHCILSPDLNHHFELNGMCAWCSTERTERNRPLTNVELQGVSCAQCLAAPGQACIRPTKAEGRPQDWSVVHRERALEAERAFANSLSGGKEGVVGELTDAEVEAVPCAFCLKPAGVSCTEVHTGALLLGGQYHLARRADAVKHWEGERVVAGMTLNKVRAIFCAWCGARPGDPCYDNGIPKIGHHALRYDEAVSAHERERKRPTPKLGDQLQPFEPGDWIMLNEDVLFGPIFPLQVRRAYKNGNVTAERTDHLGRKTEIFGVHFSNMTRCERDTPPSRAWIEKLCAPRDEAYCNHDPAAVRDGRCECGERIY